MDTLPSSKYFRKGGYPCLSCEYADDRTCGMCMFAKWNVEGLLGGFSPSEAYRKTHVQDVRDSPALLSQLENKTMPVRDMNGIPLVGLELGHVNSSVLPKV